jgi:hypothetical protein
MVKIGQSACLLPNSAMLAHGRASETERVWVGFEGLNSLSLLKIQSIPLGKLRGRRVLTAIRHLNLNLVFFPRVFFSHLNTKMNLSSKIHFSPTHPLPSPLPPLCIHCKHYLQNSKCQQKGTLDLVTGTLEYADVRHTRDTECKGTWWVPNDNLLIDPPYTQRDYFLYNK